MNEMIKISNWFKNQCNGDWEHEFGIIIQSSDNPGWNVNIPIQYTDLEGIEILSSNHRSEFDWFEAKSDGKCFIGYGGIHNLEEILAVFNTELLTRRNTSLIYDIYVCFQHAGINLWRRIEATIAESGYYRVVNIPDLQKKELVFDSIEFIQESDLSNLNEVLDIRVGDLVKCDLRTLHMGLATVVLEKVIS